MNIEAVTARALDLHEKAFMPLSQALELALSEAAPSPIWPCAKLVIKDGLISRESNFYAPGLPDGEHDVYPCPVDSDAEPVDGVKVDAPPLSTTIRESRKVVDTPGVALGDEPDHVAQALAEAHAHKGAINWPKSKRVTRPDDMSHDGTLTVGLDSDNDVYVSVFSGQRGSVSVEFCNGGGGGGRSPRTRAALIELMTAMEADAAGMAPSCQPGTGEKR